MESRSYIATGAGLIAALLLTSCIDSNQKVILEEFVEHQLSEVEASFETESGRTIEAEVLEVGAAEQRENDRANVEVKVKFSHEGKSKTLTLNVICTKTDSGWRVSGYSCGGLPEFMGEGIEAMKTVTAWLRDE